ncbi:MAG: nucleotidyltransferase family protein [Eubacteriales bacterium]|nr:nucleotidyltransferase family protein [Eubacteriales bacterium]
MKTAGIIVEYNPLHNGHQWQIKQVKATFGSDCAVVVVMSGHFTQRGEPALIDKWARAKMALDCGASLVIELPFAYATASAERFAAGGVQLLAATGITKTLVFGSEHGELPALERLAAALTEESSAFKAALAEQLELGQSFAAARQEALARTLEQPADAELLKNSNNILAVEYLKANRRLTSRSRLKPVTFLRQGQAFNDPRLQSALSSATAIRQLIKMAPRDVANQLQGLAHTMPTASLATLLEAVAKAQGPLFSDDLFLPIMANLRTRSVESLENIPGMGEGLAQRLVAIAKTDVCQTFDALVEQAMSRRLPKTRVQRALTAMLLGLTQVDYQQFDAASGPQYIRVLGFDKSGRYLLKLMREKAQLPIITRGSDFHDYPENDVLQRQAQLDIAASDLWQIAAGGKPGSDFDRAVVIR